MQINQISRLTHAKRINEMKEKMVKQPHEICIERAKLFTESYSKSKGEHPYIRFAMAMDHLLTNMTIKIWDHELIVGNRCSKYVGTPIYPEVRVDTLEQDIDTFEKRTAQQLYIEDNDRDILKNYVIPYWKNKELTVKESFLKKLDQDVKRVVDTLVFTVEAQVTNGMGHFFPGHENVLKFGINGLIQKALNRKNEISNDPQKEKFLEAVIICCEAAKKFIKRYSTLAKELADKEDNEVRKEELYRTASICTNISERPPTTFHEALQLIFFNHIICGLEDGGLAISVGRLDQLLYLYYREDLKCARIDKDEAHFLIACFFLKLSTLWNYIFYLGVNAAEGPPIAENLTIGGIDEDGKDAINELSYIILDVYSDLQTVQPTFSVRIHQSSSEAFLARVGRAIKSGASIALFNDEIMIKALIQKGFREQDARDYAPIGCVEPQHPCKSFGSTNANQFNIVKCLELAMTNGKDMFTRRDIGIKSEKPNQTYQDLWDAFLLQMKYFIKYMVSAMYTLDETIAEIKPQPFLSATTDDCIERALDVTQGGAIYNFTSPQLIGLATVADSLAVIKKVVFEDKILDFEELVQILMKNYRGEYKSKKGSEWREFFINKVPKFGNDEDYVDQIAKSIVHEYCREIGKYENYRGGLFNPGVYSTSLHLAFGTFTGASANGRKSRDPLSNGLGPTHGRDKNGPTAILNSVKKLEHGLITNGSSLLLDFHPNSINQAIFVPLIRSFFTDDGGYQVQFNVIGKDVLCDAQTHPDNYRGLVVRIAGYSVLFNELSKAAQDDIISRTQY